MAFVKIETIKSDLMIRDIERLLDLTDGITNNGSVYPMVDVWIDEATSLKYYVCKTFALNNCSWNALNKSGCVYGNKEKPIEIFGGKYQHILLNGDKDNPNNLYDIFGIGDFISDRYYICQDSKTSRPRDAITRNGTLSSSIDKSSQSSTSGVIYCFRTHVKAPIQKLPLDATLSQITEFNKEMNDEISYQCSRLSQNLKSKGVETLITDKMSSLINKVSDIQLGKKWASGSFSSQEGDSGQGITKKNIRTNLPFTPTRIVINVSMIGMQNYVITKGTIDSELNNSKSNYLYFNGGSYNQGGVYIDNITSEGFTLNLVNDWGGNHRTRVGEGAWYAFE